MSVNLFNSCISMSICKSCTSSLIDIIGRLFASISKHYPTYLRVIFPWLIIKEQFIHEFSQLPLPLDWSCTFSVHDWNYLICASIFLSALWLNLQNWNVTLIVAFFDFLNVMLFNLNELLLKNFVDLLRNFVHFEELFNLGVRSILNFIIQEFSFDIFFYRLDHAWFSDRISNWDQILLILLFNDFITKVWSSWQVSRINRGVAIIESTFFELRSCCDWRLLRGWSLSFLVEFLLLIKYFCHHILVIVLF